MKKNLFIALTVIFFMGKGFSQNSLSNLGVTTGNPLTVPANISQLEVSGRLLTQNSFSSLSPGDVRITGNFGTTARWNSLGNLNAGTQTLNGLRTQTNARGLVFGHSINNATSVLSNPFIQWIGNVAGESVQPGDLDFIVADNPGSPGVAANDRLVLRLKENGKMVVGQSDIGGNYLASMDVSTNTTRVGGLYIDVKNITTTVAPVGIVSLVRANTSFGSTGISATAYSTAASIVSGTVLKGVEGIANGQAATLIGVAGTAPGTGTVRYGVYGEAVATTGSFAGYFAGNVFATGTITASDEKLKTNIQPETGLDKLMQLNPVNYYFNKVAIADLKTPNVLQHGFIAQELEKVLPESVVDVNTPIFNPDYAIAISKGYSKTLE